MFPILWRLCPASPLTLTTPEEPAVLICGDCSARNNDGERFCNNCGAYLVWQRVPDAADEKRPLSTDPGPNRSPDVPTAQLPIVSGPPDPRPAVNIPENIGMTATRDATDRGAGLEERQPGKAGVRVPSKTTPLALDDEPTEYPGGVICRRCGAGNEREVTFCRQCGASLREAVAAPPVPPWWRQILSRTKAPALPAGSRPSQRKHRRFPARTASVLTVLGLFGGVAFVGRDVIAAAVLRGLDEIWEKSVAVQNSDASDFEPGRGPERAFDGSVRSWASAGAAQPGVDYLQAGFGTPLRLTYVVITPVARDGDQNPDKERRPVKVEIVAARGDGDPSTLTVELSDSGFGAQSFYFGADQISTVKLRILESAGPVGARVSVADVQFAGRR